VLGSGQLGRMFALEARRMGYRVRTLSPHRDTPTGQVADEEVVADYQDLEAVAAFARRVDVVTFEFENVSSEAAAVAESLVPVRPAGRVLHITQNRLREKTFLRQSGFPVAPFLSVTTEEELASAVGGLGCPAILKTAGFGYDGKGQSKIDRPEQAAAAWQRLGRRPAVLEGFIDFERELSVVAARGPDGSVADFGLFENQHQRHILDLTLAPARAEPALLGQARHLAHGLLEALDFVGVLCVELFLTKEGHLLVNELAPRPHNSGHLTLDACLTSQFEQQVRAICGLPLGATELLRPAAMANLLGDLWQQGEPDWAAACRVPGVRLHLYGKGEPRPGRKMGHLTALAPTLDEAWDNVLRARAALSR
jgi:5-(carboxyamino)imidazole ribonucleotide synthase